MGQPPPTPAHTLLHAAAIGHAAGLRYVYAGNLSGRAGHLENTRCPKCTATLIERAGFRVIRNRLASSPACPDCGAAVAGFWSIA
jgi:pyruvate formate lyase activating enzyme